MKQLQLFILFALLATGCVTKKIAVEQESVRTIQSDMFPKDISRAEYYEQMGIAYSLDNQIEKAIENFRLWKTFFNTVELLIEIFLAVFKRILKIGNIG